MTETESAIEKWDRPTGYAAIVTGVILFICGVIAIAMWAAIDPSPYFGELDQEKLAQKYWTGVVASACFAAGLPTLLAGYIVRAMYFLHGDAKKDAR